MEEVFAEGVCEITSAQTVGRVTTASSAEKRALDSAPPAAQENFPCSRVYGRDFAITAQDPRNNGILIVIS